MTHTRSQGIDIINIENTITHLHNIDTKHVEGNRSESSKLENSSSNNVHKPSKSLLGSNLSTFKNINTFLKEELAEIRHAVEDDIDYHNDRDRSKSSSSLSDTRSVVIERQGGLANRFVVFLLILWYFFSAFTLYTNKYIVTTRRSDPTLIGTFQMLVTCVCGFLQLKKTVWSKQEHLPVPVHGGSSHFNNKFNKYASYSFVRNMFIIGLLR
jgi:hypothetical protein